MSLSPFNTPLSTPSIRTQIYGLDNAKPTPQVVRKRWLSDEVVQLLTLIKKRKPLEEIAALHGRTTTAINLKRQSLAADYHFFENRDTAVIQKLTGLTKVEVEKAIAKRAAKMASEQSQEQEQEQSQEQQQSQQQSQQPDPVVTTVYTLPTQKQEPEPTMKEIMTVLLGLQEKMKQLEGPEPTMRDLMKVAKDIQARMDMLIQ
jgi:hypothetical protein